MIKAVRAVIERCRKSDPTMMEIPPSGKMVMEWLEDELRKEEGDAIRFFEYAHLPSHLGHVSSQFYFLAKWIVDALPPNDERAAALRKLLEAKDCAVRAAMINNGR